MIASNFRYILLLSVCLYESNGYFERPHQIELTSNIHSIVKVLDFMEIYRDQLNLDAYFGVTLAKAQLEQGINQISNTKYTNVLKIIIYRCQNLLKYYSDGQSNYERFSSDYSNLFKEKLLHSQMWYNNVTFTTDLLDDFGLYSNWTSRVLTTNQEANFNGLSSDQCIGELLQKSRGDFFGRHCYVGDDCKEMMFANRQDTLYLLTHRLLYLQLSRAIKCNMNGNTVWTYMQTYCTWIWKEARTNEYLGFPNTDLFLEQVLLCGMEGFEEFLTERWRRNVIDWLTIQGCYKNHLDSTKKFDKSKRTANVIAFGCVDHTTGLGLAALSLNVRYLLSTLIN